MASLNKVQLIGYTGDAPDVRKMTNGESVAAFNLATNEEWKDKAGEKQSRTDWHRVVMYRGLADIAAEHFKKGSHLFIEGRLRNRSYEDKDGVKRYVTEIIADSFQFLDKKDPNAEKITKTAPPAGPAIDPADHPFD